MRKNHLRQWALTFGGGMALCGVLAAQSPTSSTPQGGQRGMATASQGAMSATGCLQRGDTASPSSDSSAAPTTGAPPAAGASASFVLKNARFGGAGSGTSSGASGASAGTSAGSPASGSTGAGPTASAGRELRLVADTSVNLAEHVGHQVMVTGAFSGAPNSSGAPSSPAAPGSPSPDAGASPMAATGDRGPFRVSTISMISATCSGS